MKFNLKDARDNTGFFNEADTSRCAVACIQRGKTPGVGACQIVEYLKKRGHKEFEPPTNGCLAVGQMANDPHMGWS